jgi:peptidoglycan/LPS O-acetylase OafA/YrhL
VLGVLALVEVFARVAGGMLVLPGALSPYTWLIGVPIAYWFSWTLGALLAERFVKGEPGPAFLRWPWLWLGLAVAAHFTPALTGLGFTGFALATASLMGRLLDGPRRTLSHVPGLSGALTWLGVISYSLYLLHQPLMELAFEDMRPWLGSTVIGGFGFGIAIAIPLLLLAWLSYRWLERPSIAWGKVLMHRWLASPPARRT